MIVKKPYRRVKCKHWNKKRNTFEEVYVNDYIGWFLFGIIPIYMINLDKKVEVDIEGYGKDIIEFGLYKKYKHHLNKE